MVFSLQTTPLLVLLLCVGISSLLSYSSALDEGIIGEKLIDVDSVLPAGGKPFVLLHTPSGLCIHPAGAGAGAGNATLQLVLQRDGCRDSSPSALFTHTDAGYLMHEGTGKCIAPASRIVDGDKNNPDAVLQECGQHSSRGGAGLQWLFTQEVSVQHKLSRKCLHPFEGAVVPSSGTLLKVHDGCNELRLQFKPVAPSQVPASPPPAPPDDGFLEVWTGRKQSKAPSPLCCQGQQCLRQAHRPPRHAFLTTVRSSPYVTVVKRLICSLAKTNPHSHLVIMGAASDAERLTPSELEYLRHNASVPGVSVEYKVVRDVQFPNHNNPRFHLNWIKLQAWNLTDWDAIIMLDADMSVVADARHLFYLPTHVATVPFQAPGRWYYNAGGFKFLRPCAAVFEHMVSLLVKYRALQFRHYWAEQAFLNWYFFYDAFNLPMQYNANAHQHPDLRTNGTVTGIRPILLHFADKKQWEVPENDPLHRYANPCSEEFPVPHNSGARPQPLRVHRRRGGSVAAMRAGA